LDMLNAQQWVDRATEIINATYVAKYGTAGATANDNAAVRQARLGLTGSIF